jgi:hypothetical protein
MNQTALATPESAPRAGRATTDAGDERFPWDTLVSRVLLPVKVEVIEAMWWIGLPLAASDLLLVLDKDYSLSLIDYHMKALAKLGALQLVKTEPVRGALKHSYVVTVEPPGW